MRPEMTAIMNGIFETGYTGKITGFGFTDEELGEFVQEEWDRGAAMEQWEAEWKASLPKDTGQGFIDDGSLTKEEAFEMRKRGLYEKSRIAIQNYYEAKLRREPNLEALETKKNKAATEYNVHTFRADYYDTSCTQQEITLADSKELASFIQTDRMGFALCIFHNEHTPSLHITENMYFCFGCGAAGRTISFIMRQRGMNFRNAVQFLIKT